MKKYENFVAAFENLKEIALEIVRNTKEVYFKLFKTLVNKLRDEWL